MNNRGVNECSMHVTVPAICNRIILGVSILIESVLSTLGSYPVSDYRSAERNSAFAYICVFQG